MYTEGLIVSQYSVLIMSMSMKVENLTLNSGRKLPGISFGTGTSFFNRGGDVAALVAPAFQVTDIT